MLTFCFNLTESCYSNKLIKRKEIKSFKLQEIKKASSKVSKNASSLNPNIFKTFYLKVPSFQSETSLMKSPSDQITKSISFVLISLKNTLKEFNKLEKMSIKFFYWKRKLSNLLNKWSHVKKRMSLKFCKEKCLLIKFKTFKKILVR